MFNSQNIHRAACRMHLDDIQDSNAAVSTEIFIKGITMKGYINIDEYTKHTSHICLNVYSCVDYVWMR